MDNIPGRETAVYVAMIKRYFHQRQKSLYISDKSGGRHVDSSSSQNGIWECFFGPDEGSRLFLPGLDNLAAGWGSEGNFAALISYPPSLIPFEQSFWQKALMENWHFGCQKSEEQDFYVKYV